VKITEFTIKNFRSLRDVHLDNLGNLNVFIGKNSSGKSNILEGLTLVFENFNTVGGTTPGLNDFLWYNKRIQEPIEFSISVSLEKEDFAEMFPGELREYIATIGGDFRSMSFARKLVNVEGLWRTEYLKLGNLSLVQDDKVVSSEELTKAMSASNAAADQPGMVQVLTSQQIDAVCAAVAQNIKAQFKLISAVRDVKNPAVPGRMSLVDSNQQNQLWNWDQSTTDVDQDKYAGIETAFAGVTNLRLDLAGGQVYVKKPRKIPISSEGGGVQASLSIIFSMSSEQERNHIFAVEEPESHSHFDYQKQFFQIIRKFSEDNQVFLSTHSPVFVDRADPKNTWIVKLTENGTTVERVGGLKEVLGEIGAKPSDVFFFANRIIFVQNESDQIAVKAFAELMGKDLSDVLILPFKTKDNGWTHLRSWIDIAHGAIPIYLILDSTAGPEVDKLVKDGKVERDMYHIWRLGEIEEYYPSDVLREALQNLNARYNLGLDANKIMKQIREGKFRQSDIAIGEKQKVLGRSWKVLLAEQVAELLPQTKAQLRDEVTIAMGEAVPS